MALRSLSYYRSALLVGMIVAAPIAAASTSAIPFRTADVTSADGHGFAISWKAPGVRHVDVYAGTDPNHITHDRKVAEGAGEASIRVPDLPAAARWYFELAPDHGHPLVVADRSLHLSNAPNFRDVGGYRAADGEWVRMGLAYRSNAIDSLTPDELATLKGLGLKLDCDLRTDEEQQRAPDRMPAGVEQVHANVLADDAPALHAMMSPPQPGAVSSDHAKQVNMLYRDFVRAGSARTAYHALFEKLADPVELPTMFHCTGGKDRTGWADAVLLTILGVPRATIVHDYTLTDHYMLEGEALRKFQARFPAAAATSMKALAADPADLQTAFDEVSQRYGTFDNYLHQALGLDDATLGAIRKNFLAN